MSKKVAILGGSGMIGSYLSKVLHSKGYEVIIFTRNTSQLQNKQPDIHYSYWNPEKHEMDINMLYGIEGIINLTGENISGGRWTEKRKHKILESRLQPLIFLLDTLKENNITIDTLISSSAIGYYGTETSHIIFTEESPKGTDFLATVCDKWEEKAIDFQATGTRVVIIRTSLVLSKTGGVFKKLSLPAKLGLNGVSGSGKQYFPWIHIADLCNLFLFSLENEHIFGVYNAVSSHHISNKEFIESLSKTTGFKLLTLKIPAEMLNLIFGKMSSLLVKGSRVSNQKIKDAGFEFNFDTIDDCLENLIYN